MIENDDDGDYDNAVTAAGDELNNKNEKASIVA